MKYPIIAQRLKEALADKDMKPYELAEKSGVLRSSISQYMNGTNSMSNTKAGIIAEVLEVNPVWLMGFDVPKYKAKEKTPEILDIYYSLDDEGKEELIKRGRELRLLSYAKKMAETQNKKGD